MAGFDNDVVYASNVDFSGGSPVSGKVTTNGQLLIGSTASPNIRVGSLTSTGSSITISTGAGTINLEAGATTPLSFPCDSGTATPASNALTVSGQAAGSVPVMFTVGSGSSIEIEDRTRPSSFVVDASSTVGLRGTYTTITSALTDATAGSTIYVRPGSYVENITLKAGVDIVGLDGNGNSNVVAIDGTIAASFSGRASIANCQLISRNSGGLSITGSSGTIVTYENCTIAQNANAGTNYSITIANSNAEVYLFNCFGTTSTNGAWFSMSNGQLTLESCRLVNNGGTTIDNSLTGGNTFIYNSAIGTDNSVGAGINITAGALNVYNTNLAGKVTSSGTGSVLLQMTRVFTPNSTALTIGGSGSNEAYNCVLIGGTASAISVSSSLQCSNCTVQSTNTNAITGAGTINFGGLVFVGSSSLINTTTQVPYTCSNDGVRITTPGAYPYTTVPQDELILVDTSSARTITPLASPTTGQKHTIKDNVGSAATNNITVTPSGKNIDGAASTTINIAYGSVTIVYNGTQWNIV